MRNLILVSAVLCVSLTASAQDGFTITGNLPGLEPGAKVKLVSMERGHDRDIAETTATGGAFVLNGKVNSPTICEIRINRGDEGMKSNAIGLMVENLPMTVSAAHIDSVPPGFYFGTGGKLQEKNLTVTGGQAQKEYAEFCDAMFPYELASKKAHFDFYIDKNRERSPENQKRLEKAYETVKMQADSASRAFIESHPLYSVSGYLMLSDLETPFSFTSSELDSILERVKAMPETARLASVKRAVDNSRKFLRESTYSDFAALDSLGTERRLSDFAKDGKYVLVDFWASWCGPCRAAIPSVRSLFKDYGDRLNICAVSVDENPNAWKRAMKDENMEWPQMRVDNGTFRNVANLYNFHSIPFMVLINPEGKIVFAGHDTEKIAAIISANQ